MALHGRDAELALLDDALASARRGRGRAVFFTGEAGIGKSTLLAEARARGSGEIVLAGAAWESGGAPPYWPWHQVLRDAAQRAGDRVRALPGADRIAAIVPEWGERGVAPVEPPDPAAARFALLDAVTRALVALSADAPLVILLDDLHAADVPTLDVLVLVTRELARGAIALVAAWRDGELGARPDAAARLARASRHGTTAALRRLTADEVVRWVGGDAGAIHAQSDGNPLFVEELVRARHAGLPARGIASVIDAHLALVAAPTRELLADASVLGRDLDAAPLAAIAAQRDVDTDALAAMLRDAETTGIVEKRDGGHRFRHVLLRDHLYDALAPSRRAAMHRAVGVALEPSDAAFAVHHLIASGDVDRSAAAARAAAARAMRVYAFEDAAELLGHALRALDHDRTAFGGAARPAHVPARDALGRGDGVDAIDLRLELATALHAAGGGVQARAECVRAAALARARGDGERLCRAALVYALELLTGRRDAQMIALLEEARALLPPGDSSLRARVTARLAAALVPSYGDPELPERLAHEARAMARRLGDDETLLFVFRFAAHAHGFRMTLADAHALTSETMALSDKLGRPLEALEARAWLIGSLVAMGDVRAADAALDDLDRLLSPLPQPQYRYRVPILRAVRAVRRGELADARRWLAVVRDLTRDYAIDRAGFAIRFAELSILAIEQDAELAARLAEELRSYTSIIGNVALGQRAFALALCGRADEARELLTAKTFEQPIILLQFAAEAIVLIGDRERAELALPAMLEVLGLLSFAQGPAGSLVLRPCEQVIGDLLVLLGRVDEAIPHLERGLDLARRIESPPFIAQGEASLARARAAPAAAPRAPESLAICCEDAGARVRWRGRDLAAPASKGMTYLATLVAAPNRDVHVSDLIGDNNRGDAGEVLDAKARAAYRDRARELAAELDDARARNDLGRAERLAAELDAISDELLAGIGLGGRARVAGSRVERARVNVQRRIKDAIRRLASEDAALGRYLEATIRTGTFCSFVPM